MLRESTQTFPITSLYLARFEEGAINNKTCGFVLMLTPLMMMKRHIDLMLMETLALLRPTTEHCLVQQQI